MKNIEIYEVAGLFEKKFGNQPDYIVQIPGRANLIGEHVDYNGFPVIPIAIKQKTTLACSLRADNMLNIANFENLRYKDYSMSLTENYIFNRENSEQYDYALCGIFGVAEYLNKNLSIGMNIFIKGDIPKGAGLSSSSSLVCAFAMATSKANGFDLSNEEIAKLCAKAEKLVAIEGGGMDQAICMLAKENYAKFIQFFPLRLNDIILPSGAIQVILNSLVESHKREDANIKFNLRVVECRFAAHLLAKIFGLKNQREIKTISIFKEKSGLEFNEILKFVNENFHSSTYSFAEIQKAKYFDDADIFSILSDIEITLKSVLLHTSIFKIYQRIVHVITESIRVKKFREICLSKTSDYDKIKKLGKILNKSHLSCKNNYDCSCEELDILQKAALLSGAEGSRLTGAGQGGCIISLVRLEHTEIFLEKIMENYYNKIPSILNNNLNKNEYIFVTHPSNGALIYDCKV